MQSKPHLESFDEWYKQSTYKGSTDGLERTNGNNYWISKGTGRTKMPGWIKSEHTMLYNILRGKPVHTGYNPITNPRKMNRWLSDMNTFYLTVVALENRVRWAQSLIADDKALAKYRKEHGVISVVEKLNLFVKGINENFDLVDNERFITLVNNIRKYSKKPKDILCPGSREWREENIEEFLEPFAGTVTLEMLVKVDVDQLKMIKMFDRNQKTNYWMSSI